MKIGISKESPTSATFDLTARSGEQRTRVRPVGTLPNVYEVAVLEAWPKRGVRIMAWADGEQIESRQVGAWQRLDRDVAETILRHALGRPPRRLLRQTFVWNVLRVAHLQHGVRVRWTGELVGRWIARANIRLGLIAPGTHTEHRDMAAPDCTCDECSMRRASS